MSGPGIDGPSLAPEGGTITVSVSNGAARLAVYVDGSPTPTYVDVVGGKATFPVPSTAHDGSIVTIMTLTRIPASHAVEIVSTMH